MTKALVLCSGGLDSTTAVYLAREEGEVELVSFDYGQSHRVELARARETAHRLGAQHWPIAMPAQFQLALRGASALTGGGDVPDGHYAEETMRATVVPNRNMMMLSIAASIAVARKCDSVWCAVHGGDHFIYPDCRPDFIEACAETIRLSTEGSIELVAPFVHLTKAEIVLMGTGLGVPFGETWSCYKGGEIHCGACGTCFERREAFAIAGIDDPTQYLALPVYETPESAR